ncbi:MAG: hypothetical protein M1820_003715 [Bogoriella megaspora]|nr:MAG: hypothetical protein M1820_003715 [Bogoriella megaspora]
MPCQRRNHTRLHKNRWDSSQNDTLRVFECERTCGICPQEFKQASHLLNHAKLRHCGRGQAFISVDEDLYNVESKAPAQRGIRPSDQALALGFGTDRDDDDACVECGSKAASLGRKGANQLVGCRRCPDWYHQNCHSPNIGNQFRDEQEEWLCSACERALGAVEGDAGEGSWAPKGKGKGNVVGDSNVGAREGASGTPSGKGKEKDTGAGAGVEERESSRAPAAREKGKEVAEGAKPKGQEAKLTAKPTARLTLKLPPPTQPKTPMMPSGNTDESELSEPPFSDSDSDCIIVDRASPGLGGTSSAPQAAPQAAPQETNKGQKRERLGDAMGLLGSSLRDWLLADDGEDEMTREEALDEIADLWIALRGKRRRQD